MITKDIVYIGADDKDLDLFEGQYPVPNGVSYNSYVILDEKIAVMDTVDKRKTEEFLANLDAALNGRQPDYLVVNHVEPDHAANIQCLQEKYPDMQLVGNAKTFQMLLLYFPNLDLSRSVTVKEGDTLSLGRHTLHFVMAPMVHWPEVMMTYDDCDKVLFSADGFGKFGAYRKIPVEDDCRMIDLNCKALVAMTELTLPYMKRGAKLLNLDSLSAFQPVPYLNVYGSTKAFVLSYSRSMNRELKTKGIRVMAMNPGWVKTEFFNHAFQTNADNEVRYFNRLYEAKDVVKTGLNDLYHSKKDCSIHGFPVKFQVFLVKLLPHSLVMNTWLNQQKKAKNNKGLTTK